MILDKIHPENRIDLFCKEISNGYLDTWHKKISLKKIKVFCSKQ